MNVGLVKTRQWDFPLNLRARHGVPSLTWVLSNAIRNGIACRYGRTLETMGNSNLYIRFSNAVLFGVMLSICSLAYAQEMPPPADVPPESSESQPSTQPTASSPPTAGYDIKLHELEEKVVGLKERIFKTKTRLILLREQILHNVIAEARVVIVHKNDMSNAFTLEQVIYELDGEKIYYSDNQGGVLDERREFEVFNGNRMPGNHRLSVELIYRGNGTLFSYIDGYVFKIRSNYTFFAAKGRISRIKVVGFEKGGITTDLEQKPYVRYEVQQLRYTGNTPVDGDDSSSDPGTSDEE